jgi:CBS domain-containing protein
MTSLRTLLAKKDGQILTISGAASVAEAVRVMNQFRVGAVLIARDSRIQGIFTERDVLRRVIESGTSLHEMTVSDVMTPDVICCTPDTSIEEASRLMKERRVRHLPICDEDGRLVGMISIGDLNAHYLTLQEARIQELEDFVYGRS